MSNVKHEIRIVFHQKNRLTPHTIVFKPAPNAAVATPTVRTAAIGVTVTPAITTLTPT